MGHPHIPSEPDVWFEGFKPAFWVMAVSDIELHGCAFAF